MTIKEDADSNGWTSIAGLAHVAERRMELVRLLRAARLPTGAP